MMPEPARLTFVGHAPRVLIRPADPPNALYIPRSAPVEVRRTWWSIRQHPKMRNSAVIGRMRWNQRRFPSAGSRWHVQPA
jgi:hypothetical protein